MNPHGMHNAGRPARFPAEIKGERALRDGASSGSVIFGATSWRAGATNRSSSARSSRYAERISERHRHRYEFNPEYRHQFVDAGMRLSGVSPDGGLVEIIELADHPWYVAVQFHPEFKSKPNRAHPVFSGFIEAALNHHQQRLQMTL